MRLRSRDREHSEAIARVADAIRAVEGSRADVTLRTATAAWMTASQLGSAPSGTLHPSIVRAVEAMPRDGSFDAIDRAHESLVAMLDPSRRSHRGAYFTPVALARFVVEQAREIVAGRFDGERAIVVDPAAGAGVFLDVARAAFGDRPATRFVANEIDETTAAVLRTRFASDPRVDVRHVDTLVESSPWAREGEVLVVLGNPPFNGRSKSDSTLVARLLRGIDPIDASATTSYYHVDGSPLGERNPKWLQDDCVKFVRYAQWQLARAQRGVVALVCTQAFVHQPTFRAMRASLWRSHHEVRVLDLHGNTKKLERTPDGSRDDNVFDIQQGVCVLVLVRHGDDVRSGRVRFADLWGRRHAKLAALERPPTWQHTTPTAPRFAFALEDDRLRAEYERGIPLDELFVRFSPAVVTGRDGFAVARAEIEMRERVEAVHSSTLDDDAFRERFLRRGDRIDVTTARKRTRELAAAMRPCLYRPFDERVLFDSDAWLERPRREVMRAFDRAGPSIALLARRQSPPARPAPFVFATRFVPIDGVIRSDNHGSESVFPLEIGRESNLAAGASARFAATLGSVPSPREIFAYGYATLHAPAYRANFASLLRQDYPRIPLPRDADVFAAVARAGEALLAIHLDWRSRARCSVAPSEAFRVRRPQFVEGAVDAGARFAPLSEAAWEFAVGGYQPLRKWLDDRVGETLDPRGIDEYARIVTAVEETVAIVRGIDLGPPPA